MSARDEAPEPEGAPRLEIRDVRDTAERRACQELQRRAWGITEDGYVMPVATMAAVQKVGGLVLGAFERDRLVGFSFAFLGRVHGELVMYSQLTAIDPDLQGRGLGRQLKQEQRRRAGEQGLGQVAWAFDPLQASNCFFNLAVLGARVRTYEVNLYGTRTDTLNAGLETDRLVAEWPTVGEPRGRSVRWQDGLELIESVPAAGGRRPEAVLDPPHGIDRVHVEIPGDIAAVKAGDLELAQAWQQAVRRALQTALAAGFTVVGFARGERPCHLLERSEP